MIGPMYLLCTRKQKQAEEFGMLDTMRLYLGLFLCSQAPSPDIKSIFHSNLAVSQTKQNKTPTT